MRKISSPPASQTAGGTCRAGQFSLWETSRVAAWLSHRQPILDANFGCGFRMRISPGGGDGDSMVRPPEAFGAAALGIDGSGRLEPHRR